MEEIFVTKADLVRSKETAQLAFIEKCKDGTEKEVKFWSFCSDHFQTYYNPAEAIVSLEKEITSRTQGMKRIYKLGPVRTFEDNSEYYAYLTLGWSDNELAE